MESRQHILGYRLHHLVGQALQAMADLPGMLLPMEAVDLVPVERLLLDRLHACSLVPQVAVPRAEEPANNRHSGRAIPPEPLGVQPDRHQDDLREKDFPGALPVLVLEQADAVHPR